MRKRKSNHYGNEKLIKRILRRVSFAHGFCNEQSQLSIQAMLDLNFQTLIIKLAHYQRNHNLNEIK